MNTKLFRWKDHFIIPAELSPETLRQLVDRWQTSSESIELPTTLEVGPMDAEYATNLAKIRGRNGRVVAEGDEVLQVVVNPELGRRDWGLR